jgi:hypothetical protein
MLDKKDLTASILRVNKQVYAESYKVMIKGNRFVHVCCTGGVHFAHMLKAHNVPTLAFDMDDGKKKEVKSEGKIIEPVTQRFLGYALRITIGNKSPNSSSCSSGTLSSCARQSWQETSACPTTGAW